MHNMHKVSLVAVLGLLAACAHDHEEKKYTCTIDGAALSVGSTYAAANCARLPAEGIKVQVLNLTVPASQTFGLRFYTNAGENVLNSAGGVQVEFTNSQVAAAFANGAAPTTQNHGGATSFCLEVHDVTKEKHIQVFAGESCSGTALIDFEDSTASALSARAVAYLRTDASVTVGTVSLRKDAHGHDH